LQEALETINHLITVREGIEAWRNGSLQGKNPEERAKFLHKFLSSVVAIGAKSPALNAEINLISKAIVLALRDHPDTKADIFTALFDPSKKYSPAELEFLRSAIENKETSGLGAFIVDCFQASLKTSSEAMLSSLLQFSSYCKSGGPAILALHQQAEDRIGILQPEMVARRSERLGESREALHHSLGRVDRFLQAFHLLSQRSSSQAALACSQILDNLTVVIEDVRKKTTEVNKGKLQAEIAELEKDHTFQNVLQANPLFKERYLQLKSQLPWAAAEVAAQPEDAAKDVRSEMGKVGRFLGRIGLLGHLTPRRAQQACEVVITRLERVMRDLPKNVDSDLGSEALRATLSGLTIQIGELRSNPQFLSVVHSNEDLGRRLNALESEVNELGILDNCRYEAKNAHTLSEKARVARKLQQFNPESPRAVEQKKLLCAQYGPKLVQDQVLGAMRTARTWEEKDSLYGQLSQVVRSGLFSDPETGMVHGDFIQLRAAFSEDFFRNVPEGLGPLVDTLPKDVSVDVSQGDLEALCAEADKLSERFAALRNDPDFLEYRGHNAQIAAEFAAKSSELEEKKTLYHEMLELKKIESRIGMAHLSILERGQIANDLQDLEVTSEVGKRLKEKLCGNPLVIPRSIYEDLRNTVYPSPPQALDGLRTLFNDIGELQKLGIFTGDTQKEKGLETMRMEIPHHFVREAVRFLASHEQRGLMPNTALGKKISSQRDELMTVPEFRRVLDANPEFRTTFHRVQQQRAAQSKTPEKVMQTMLKFLDDTTPRGASSIQDFESLASDLVELGKDLPAASRPAYDELKEKFLARLSEFEKKKTPKGGDLPEDLALSLRQIRKSLGLQVADDKEEIDGAIEGLTVEVSSLDGSAAKLSDFNSLAEEMKALEKNLPESSREGYEALKIAFFNKLSEFVQNQISKGGGNALGMIGLCKRLLELRSSFHSQDPSSKGAIDGLIGHITRLVSSLGDTVPVAQLNEIRSALSRLQPESGISQTCLTIEQNKKIEIAKQRLTVLAAKIPPQIGPTLHELAFAVSFLTKYSPETVGGLQPKIEEARRCVQKSFDDLLKGVTAISSKDRAAIVRVLSWDPKATMSDVAVLVRNKENLPKALLDSFPVKTVVPYGRGLYFGEAVLEYMNAVGFGDNSQLSVEDFTTLEDFFEGLNTPVLQNALIGSKTGEPTKFRLKQQTAERKIWDHRPEATPDGTAVRKWYTRQKEAAAADEGAIARCRHPYKEYSQGDLRATPTVSGLSPLFGGIDSTGLVAETPDRELPTAMMSSEIVPPTLVQHLLRDQVDAAVTRKAAPVSGDGIVPPWLVTNMESIAGVFCTEFGVGEARASVFHQRAVDKYPKGQVRHVIVMRNVHPDAESAVANTSPEGTTPVFLMLAALGDVEVQGEKLPDDFKVPTAEERLAWSDAERQAYDARLLKHYVYGLYPNHVRPAKSAVSPENVLTLDGANSVMEGLIKRGASPEDIMAATKDKYIQIEGKLVSLGIYLMAAIHQTRQLLAVGEATTDGYTCPLTPPVVFALRNKDPRFHSRLQCLAFQFIGPEKFTKLKVLAPSTFVDVGKEDEGIVGLYQTVFKDKGVSVRPLSEIYDPKTGKMNEAKIKGTLIQPTNSDALGDNYNSESHGAEGSTGGSLEAVVGKHMRAGFHRDNPHRMDHVYYV
jgi:hypothetical protein